MRASGRTAHSRVCRSCCRVCPRLRASFGLSCRYGYQLSTLFEASRLQLTCVCVLPRLVGKLAALDIAPELNTAASRSVFRKLSERESEDSWFPFRRHVGAKEVQELIQDAVTARVQRGELDAVDVQHCSRLLLNLVLDALGSRSDSFQLPFELQRTAVQMALRLLQKIANEPINSDESSRRQREDAAMTFLSSLGKSIRTKDWHQLAQSAQLDEALSALHDIGARHGSLRVREAALEMLAALSTHPSAMPACRRRGVPEVCVGSLIEQWRSNSDDCEQVQRSLLHILSLPPAADVFFTSSAVQNVIGEATLRLLSSSLFTLAMNSSPDECPYEVHPQMNDLMLLRCCLSTQHATDALLRPEMATSETNRIVHFIVHTLANHGDTCASACDREDLCTLAWELALALALSIPAVLACADLFVANKLVVLLANGARSSSQEDGSVSPCTLLQMQLQDAFEVVGGPSEKVQRCALHEFDLVASGWGPSSGSERRSGSSAVRGEVTSFVHVLSEKMLASIQTSCERSVPLDFIMLSQASWELIVEIESQASLSSLELTKVIGRLLYALVLNKRGGRADELPSEVARGAPVARPTSSLDATFPSDAQRRLLNQLYKGYCGRLGLKASPTMLHCIVKKFGRSAIDTFPVTALMVLDEVVGEKEALVFLVHCWSSADCGFLWTSTAVEVSGSADCSPLDRVASAVEFVLETEDPQVRRRMAAGANMCCANVTVAAAYRRTLRVSVVPASAVHRAVPLQCTRSRTAVVESVLLELL